MAKSLPYNATLTERVDISRELAIFRITPDDPSGPAPWFAAGQYCVIGINNDARPELGSVRRAMTIASAPEQPGPLEFYIKWIAAPDSENPLTHLLWPLGVGDRLHLRTHAAGQFTIADTVGERDPRLRVLAAAGTGIAPFASMVRSAAHRGAELSQYALLHGVSRPSDLAYDDELQALEARGLRYAPTVSRPEAAPGWERDSGRVEDFFAPERLAALEARLGLPTGGLTPDAAVVYVCGLRGTIGACLARLVGRGFTPDHRRLRKALGAPDEAQPSLFYEQYDTTPVVSVRDPDAVAPLRAAYQAALSARPDRGGE